MKKGWWSRKEKQKTGRLRLTLNRDAFHSSQAFQGDGSTQSCDKTDEPKVISLSSAHFPPLKILPQRKNVLVDGALVQSYHIQHRIVFWMQIWEYKSFYRSTTQFITLLIYSSNYLLKGSPLQSLASCGGPECTVMLACMKQSTLLMIWSSPMLFLNI